MEWNRMEYYVVSSTPSQAGVVVVVVSKSFANPVLYIILPTPPLILFQSLPSLSVLLLLLLFLQSQY